MRLHGIYTPRRSWGRLQLFITGFINACCENLKLNPDQTDFEFGETLIRASPNFLLFSLFSLQRHVTSSSKISYLIPFNFLALAVRLQQVSTEGLSISSWFRVRLSLSRLANRANTLHSPRHTAAGQTRLLQIKLKLIRNDYVPAGIFTEFDEQLSLVRRRPSMELHWNHAECLGQGSSDPRTYSSAM